MSRTDKVGRILQEVDAIERIIRPYEIYSTEVSTALNDIAKLRERLKNPEKVDLIQVLQWFKEGERRLDYYRGQQLAEEVINHIEKIKNIITEA